MRALSVVAVAAWLSGLTTPSAAKSYSDPIFPFRIDIPGDWDVGVDRCGPEETAAVGIVHRVTFLKVIREDAGPGVGISYDMGTALCLIGPQAPGLVAGLLPLLRDKRAHVRDIAVKTLGCIGAPAQAAATAVRQLLADPDPNVRFSAKRALERLDTQSPSGPDSRSGRF